MRSLHRLTKLGKGFFRDKYYKYLVHVPVITGAGGQVEASLDCDPILQLLDETYFLDPEGHWVVSTQSTHSLFRGGFPNGLYST